MAGPIPQVGWVDADSQPSFLQGLGLSGPDDAPTCLLLQRSQHRIARMAASFSADAVAQLLVRGNFQPLRVSCYACTPVKLHKRTADSAMVYLTVHEPLQHLHEQGIACVGSQPRSCWKSTSSMQPAVMCIVGLTLSAVAASAKPGGRR